MHALLLMMSVLPGQATAEPQFSEALQNKALQATVRVVHKASNGEGSGVVIRYEGGIAYVLTSAHIIDQTLPNGDEVEITFFPKGKSRADVAPIKTLLDPKSRMPEEDLAVIRLALKDPPPSVLPLCPKDQAPSLVFRSIPERDGPPPPNQPLAVMTVGMGPLGTPEVILDRILIHRFLRKTRDSPGIFHWETEKEQAVGRSGGPLIDANGRVIGICSGTMNQKGYYLSVYEIHRCLLTFAWGFLSRPSVSSPADANLDKTGLNGKKN
jgi:trypsin-like peptidase